MAALLIFIPGCLALSLEEVIIESELALFPLNTVLFPATFMPLQIFEPRYVDLVGRCMRDDAGFGVIAIMNGSETGRPAQPYDVGTRARIVDFDQGTDGLLEIMIRGEERFRLLDTSVQADNLLVGRVAGLDKVAEQPIPGEFQTLASLLEEIVAGAETAGTSNPTPATAAELAYGLAQYLPLTVAAKVALLEIGNPLDLLERLAHDVRRLRHMAR